MNIFVFNERPHDRTENHLGGSGPNVCIDFTRLSPCVLCNPPRVRRGNKWGETDSAYCSVHKGLQHPHAHTCVLWPKQRATLNTVCTLLWHTINYNSPVPHNFNFGSKYFNVAIVTRLPVCWRKCPFDHFSEWGFSSSEMVIDHIDWTIILVYQNFRPAAGGPSIILLNNHFSVSKFSPQKAENDHSCERSF